MVGRRGPTAIAEAGDPRRAPGMQAYMKSALPFRGAPAPVLRKVVRAVLDQHPPPDRASWQRAVRLYRDPAPARQPGPDRSSTSVDGRRG